MSEAEAKALAATLAPSDWHKVLLAMIDARMDADSQTPDEMKELTALADACAAYEAVMFPT